MKACIAKAFALLLVSGCLGLITAGCGKSGGAAGGGEAATPEKVKTEGERSAQGQAEMYKMRVQQGK